MYKAYFGLQENPFTINTDPRYLYATAQTRSALSCLEHGIEARKGFILLTGEVGTGKTTLLNKLLESLQDQRVATAFVFNPRLNAAQLFDYMMADLGITCKSRMKSQVLFRLNQWLLDRYQKGEHTVLVVDEAQNLSRPALEEIRLLTNLETSTEKLLQIVLAGQPELEQKLNQRPLRQLRQRIALRAKTLPLTVDETREYIAERLRIGGSNGEEIFTAEAMDSVFRNARGIPRVTNLICEHALIRAFVEQRKPISADIVENVTREFSLDEGELLAQPVAPEMGADKGGGRKRAARSRGRDSRTARRSGGRRTGRSLAGQQLPTVMARARLPLFVYGCSPEGAQFYEEANAIATSARGGLISMQTEVQPGQRMIITNIENECSQECVVEFTGPRLARGVDVAFEFSTPAPQFWGTAETEKHETRETDGQASSENEKVCA